jgi:predicted nuclease of predicted toxin-antitoxin system
MSADATRLRFLVDMPVARRVAEWLRAQGHDATHTAERGLQRATDADLFRVAAAEQRIVLTLDLDFGAIAARSRGVAVSVLLLRLADLRGPAVIARRAEVLPVAAPELLRGAVVTVEESRVRVRRLPIGSEDV